MLLGPGCLIRTVSKCNMLLLFMDIVLLFSSDFSSETAEASFNFEKESLDLLVDTCRPPE